MIHINTMIHMSQWQWVLVSIKISADSSAITKAKKEQELLKALLAE